MTHGRAHQTLTFILQFAKLPYFPDAHVGVANDIRGSVGRESNSLKFARRLHTLTNHFTRFTELIPAQLFVIHPWNLDMNVNTVEQGTRDSLLIFGDHDRGASAGLE